MNAADAIRATLLDKFRSTARERFDRIGRAVLELGTPQWTNERQRAALHELHTVKGEARMMRFGDVSTLAHASEELLLQPHDGAAAAAVREPLLEMFDLALAIVQGQPVGSDVVKATVDRARAFADDHCATQSPARAHPIALHSADSSVRIDIGKLDDLTEVSGNLTVSQGTIAYALDDLLDSLRRVDDGTAASILTALSKIRDDVRENGRRVQALEAQVRAMRLLPLASLFDAYPRAVHDLAHEQAKEVRVEIVGNDVAIDKHVFEALAEPLLHLVRNAVDHGIETSDERLRAGKDPIATIVLSAEQRGGWVEIDVRDDGRGIAPRTIRDAVVRLGLLTQQEVATRTDAQILAYLFRPGFSTRTTVTDLSGRGMGLDIVKQRIEALGGSVRIDSEPGAGSSFLMRVPISVVLVRAVVAEAAGVFCAIPADATVQRLALDTDKVRRDGTQTLLDVDGQLMPLFELAQLLGDDVTRPPRMDSDQVLVVQAETNRIAVIIDRLCGEQTLVHRSMDPFCEGLRLIAGSATLDSGDLVFLLNVPELVAACDPHQRTVTARVERQRSVLVVDDSQLTRDLVAQTLRQAGFAVEEAEHGAQALERLRDFRPDVIVSDLDMPEVDGWSLLTQVRRQRNLRDVPVVVFSSRGDAHDRERAKALGADAYLVKTQTLESLLVATVARVVGEGGRQ